MFLLQITFLIILMSQVSGNVLDTVSGIRLVGGSGPLEGRVELQIAGIWGTVCDTNFDMDNAEVLCRMLNLKATSYIKGAYHGEGTDPVYVDNLRCNGYESDVRDCPYDYGSTCLHSNDISLICTECGDIRVGKGNLSISSDGRTLQISCHDESVANLGTSNCTQDGTWSQPAVYCNHKEYPLPFTGHRLEYGAGLYDGRVELLLNGTWGTICGNGFREIEAVVICNMFNLSYDRHYPGDHYNAYYYRTGSGPVYIDNLYCTGTENNINQCIYDVVDVCDRYEYPVAVVCKDEQMNITEIRLVDGTSPHEGRVELFWNGVWGTVLDSYVDEEDARFLCAMLNLNYTHHYGTPVFGYGDEPILIDSFQCDPSAKFISANDCVITAPYRSRSDRSRALSLICTICPEPSITNGKFTSSNGSEIVVTCDAGFVPSQVTLYCDSGVAWVQEEWCTRYEWLYNFTKLCDHITGECLCSVGWNDTICGMDIDECENSTACPSEHSNCTNTQGGFVCGCEIGYYGMDDDACHVCTKWTFGVECGSNCSCVKTNTGSCDHKTGQCMCKAGWNGTDCDTDIDECENSTVCPSENSNCTNTEGGFVCGCKIGYFLTDDNSCTVCTNWTFGVECALNCSCVETNTESCDHMTGMCVCEVGWNGTDCGTDINECDNSIACPEHSNCTNTEGGFMCGCEIGYNGMDGDVCNECSEWMFGVECESSCTCNQSNTASCDHVTGLCICKDGWNGSNCEMDINECENETTCPNEHSYCNNTDGGFECNCKGGYFEYKDNSCNVCPEWKYGLGCNYNCSCFENNTQSCYHETGFCNCTYGWEGTDCGDDINECNNSTACPNGHFNCTNTIGGYMCDCDAGYFITDINTCDVCPNWNFGFGCALSCVCVQSNTQSCDHLTGLCSCKDGWNGPECENDIDECENTNSCPAEHSFCVNTEGGFRCECDVGYQINQKGICKAKKVIVKHVIKIRYVLPPATDLTDNRTLQHLKEKSIDALTAFYAKRTSMALSFHIFDIRNGSLIVNYSMASDVRDSNGESGIIKAIQDLNEGSVIEFEGENYYVTSDSVTSNEPCELYNTLIGECESGYRCVVENEAGICRQEFSYYTLGVIIGVQTPVVIIVFIVCLVVNLRKHNERQRMKESQIATGFNTLRRNQGDGQLSLSMFSWALYAEAHMQYNTAYDNESYV